MLFFAWNLNRWSFMFAAVVAGETNKMSSHKNLIFRCTISQDRRLQADEQNHDREKK